MGRGTVITEIHQAGPEESQALGQRSLWEKPYLLPVAGMLTFGLRADEWAPNSIYFLTSIRPMPGAREL